MMIDFNQEVKRDNGTSIVSETKSFNVVEKDGEFVSEPIVNYKPITILADVCKGALVSGLVKITVEETMIRFNLHNKIKDGGEIELTDEELKTLKELVNNKYDLLMAGKLLVMLGEK